MADFHCLRLLRMRNNADQHLYRKCAFMIGKGAPQEVAATLGGIICLSLFVGGYLGTFLMKVIKRVITLFSPSASLAARSATCFAGGFRSVP